VTDLTVSDPPIEEVISRVFDLEAKEYQDQRQGVATV